MKRSGVRQLAAAFGQASLLAVHRSAVPGAVEVRASSQEESGSPSADGPHSKAPTAPRMVIMDELIERYVNYLQYERNASPHTVRNYRSDLLQFRDYLAEGCATAAVDVRSVDALRIRGFLSILFSRQEKKSSIARKLSAVRAFFKFLKREGVLAENPSTLVSTPKQDKTLPRIMTEEEMNAFLDAVAEATKTGEPAMRRDRALLEMLYASGLRVSELVGLDLRSVNFGDCMVLVRGKGRKERIVPFGSKAKQALEDYLPVRQRILQERKKSGQQALFLNVWGERLTTRSVDRLVKKYVRYYGRR